MAVYKVPQDVEADDKLLGPFSFRQFIYLIVVAGSIAIAWVLGNVFLPLAVIPLPIILLFGALALPLKKDQPMETYLAAIISFYLKPRRRLWDPDGQQALVEITAPKVVETHRTKDLSQTEAEQRLNYLASIVDSHGWAVRGVAMPENNTAMNSDAYYEAQQAEDVLDDSTRTAHIIENQLDQASSRRRQELLAKMQRPTPATQQQSPVAQPVQDLAVPVQPQAPIAQTDASAQSTDVHLTINPYPTMHQSVVQPLGQSAPQTPQQTAAPEPAVQPQTTSVKQPSPDIINLANNPDLSVETIAHEANRIKQKEEGLPENEVVISLH